MSDEPKITVRERKPRKLAAETHDPVNPEMHVRAVRDTPKRIELHKKLGYVVAKESDVQMDTTAYAKDDGALHQGYDRILMICPKKDVVAKREDENYDAQLEYEDKIEAARAARIEDTGSRARRGRKVYSIP